MAVFISGVVIATARILNHGCSFFTRLHRAKRHKSNTKKDWIHRVIKNCVKRDLYRPLQSEKAVKTTVSRNNQ